MVMNSFQPHPLLKAYIEGILVQEDFNESNFANQSPVKVLPSSYTVMGIQYGQPMNRVENGIELAMGTSGITGLQTAYREYRSTGSIGTIIIQFKPGGLASFTAYPIQEFQDMNVELKQIFRQRLISDMEEQLAESTNIPDRVHIVQSFLLSILKQVHVDQMILHATHEIQKRTGQVTIEALAGQYFVSKRTLERKFNQLIGVTPKKFANIVRFQHAIQLRKSGYDFLDIVQRCNYSDQSHFTHEFRAFTGCSPEQFFRVEIQPELVRAYNGTPELSRWKQSMYQ